MSLDLRRPSGGQALKVRKENIGAALKQLEETRAERRKCFRELLSGVLNGQGRYERVIEAFSKEKSLVLSDLDFKAGLEVDVSGLLGAIYEVVDNRQVEVMGSTQRPSDLTELRRAYLEVASGKGGETEIDALVGATEKAEELLRTKLKKAFGVTRADLYRGLYAQYLRVRPEVQYKKTRLESLSLGQKATVLLKIYLAQGEAPIIIDSHDDHLDNAFIMEELVAAIRQAKTDRQVLLVSNNGNVVVNSDAEQVVIADRETGEISYSSGALESPEIRA